MANDRPHKGHPSDLEKGPLTMGARKFRKWLRARKLSVPAFCEEQGFDHRIRVNLQNVLCGRTLRVSVDLAYAVQKATSIPVEWWRSETATRTEAA
jgi:hypothetical protein